MIQSGCGLIAYQSIDYNVLPVLKARGFNTFRFISHDQTCIYNTGGSTIQFTTWMRIAREICLRYSQACVCTLTPLSAPTDIRDPHSGIPTDWAKMQDYLYHYFDYFLTGQLDSLTMEVMNEPEASTSYWIKDYTTGVRSLSNLKLLWDTVVAARDAYLAAHPEKTIHIGGPCFVDSFYASEFNEMVTYMAPEADFISAHVYGANSISSTSYQSWMNTINVAADGVAKPIWITECGPYWDVGVYDPQASHQTDAENWYTGYLAYCDTLGVTKSFMHLGYQLESASGRVWHLIEADLHPITQSTAPMQINSSQQSARSTLLQTSVPVLQPQDTTPRLLGGYFDGPTLNSTVRHWFAVVNSASNAVIVTEGYDPPSISQAIAVDPNQVVGGTIDLGVYDVDFYYQINACNTSTGLISESFVGQTLRCTQDTSPNLAISYTFDPIINTKTATIGVVANKALSGVWVGQGTPPAWGDASIIVHALAEREEYFFNYIHDAFETVSDLNVAGYDTSHAFDQAYPQRTVTFDQIEWLLTGQADFNEDATATMTISRRLKIALTAPTSPPQQQVTVTLGGTATLNTHYSAPEIISGVVTVGVNTTSKQITLEGIPLPSDYTNRTITAVIAGVPANEAISSTNSASFNLLNIDSVPTTPVTAQFSTGSSAWNEGDSATVAFSLSDGIGPATVTLHVPATAYTTAEDTAINVTTEGQTYAITLKSTAGDQGGLVVPVTIDGAAALGRLTHNLSITDTLSADYDGVPSLDFATEAGPFLYRNPSTGLWYFYIGGAGTSFSTRTTWAGSINSTTGFTNFSPISIESDDVCTQSGNEITLSLHSQGTSSDGCSFQVDTGTTTLTITSNASATLYLGVGKVPVALTAGVAYTIIDNGAAPGSFSAVTADSVAGTVAVTWVENVTAPKPARGFTFQKPLKTLVAP